MIIANGFITETPQQAFMQVCERCDGYEVRTAPLPTVGTMTYWLSAKGDVYGCQRMKTMCLTKPVRVENRYRKGCHIRYSTGHGNQCQAFMQNVMYSTFVTGEWDADMEFTFLDGNPYNFALHNLKPKKPSSIPVLLNNMDALQNVYQSHHLDVAWYIRKSHADIPLDDCKDIASDTFFYLCSFRAYKPDYFVGIWKQTAEHRAIDWWKRYVCNYEGLYWEDNGEERFGRPDRTVEVADIWGAVRGEKRKRYLRLWSHGETNVEIAESTGASYGTVSGEISRAISELKTVFKKDRVVTSGSFKVQSPMCRA